MPTEGVDDSVRFEFGTKAETLERLQPLVRGVSIPPLHHFSVADWAVDPKRVLNAVRSRFAGAVVAVRSSARVEDSALSSMAGAFLSKLGVSSSDEAELEHAIDRVAGSMTGNSRDQVLVQDMVTEVAVSGVIMTYDMVHGAPYYCIDFDEETGRTDAVTSGRGIHKGLFVYRYADDAMVRSTRIAAFLGVARELEAICGCSALDIEFGVAKTGQIFLFQVRRMALSRNWHPVTERRINRQLAHVEQFVRHCSRRRGGILGARTILAIMPDWNPAEIIGTTPRQLAASLYRELITKATWRAARSDMGYRDIGDGELMVLINHHPYIDVRQSFNSFLPAGLGNDICEKLVEAWLDRLEASPEFHDKIEFEVVPTCIDFCFESDFRNRYPDTLSPAEFDVFHGALTALTRRCLSPGPANTLDLSLDRARHLEVHGRAQIDRDDDAYAVLARAQYLLGRCEHFGTYSFAVVARHAFIAESILRSAVRRGALSEARLTAFRRSIRTVTGSMVAEYSLVCRGELSRAEFLHKFGHLRPGTYEITSLRYDERDDLFNDDMRGIPEVALPDFALIGEERAAIERLLEQAGLDVVDADQLLDYSRRAIAGREQVKFIFTRTLSDALSQLVRWGEYLGLSRDDLSHLDWSEIGHSLTLPLMDDPDRHFLDAADRGRRSMAAAHGFRLGHIIFGVRDIYVATLNRSVPNFVGIGSASGMSVQLTANTSASIDVRDRIVCIENADPGFDWIFTKGPSALITRFGGANSHMAIRCAELGLPAAIGCGDQIFQRIVEAGCVEIDCSAKTLRPIYAR